MNDHCEQCPSQVTRIRQQNTVQYIFVESLRVYVDTTVHRWVSKKCQCKKTTMNPSEQFLFWSLSQTQLNRVCQQNRLSSSSTSKVGTICSAELTSCSPGATSCDDSGCWNHGWASSSVAVSLSQGSFLSRLWSRHLAFGDKPSGKQHWPLRILENSVAGSGSWKG